jgi:anti-sigma regulatory factor (Ser/Thr protein kinase)/anti-anti-sigma regulatory factor
MEIVRLVDSRLAVRIQVAPPFFVSELAGSADESGQATLREWTQRMAEEVEPFVVLEMSGLDQLTGPAAATLTRGLREAQRLDKGVRLVRCRRSDYDRLADAGLRGEVWHCGSLAQATEGALGGADTATRLHFRAELSALPRLELMLGVLASKLQFPHDATEALRGAVLEAAANAVRHGSPGGSSDHVSVFIHRHPGELVVEVQDRGRGIPEGAEGHGIRMMRRLMDEVEYLPNPDGLLTRLSLRVSPGGNWS